VISSCGHHVLSAQNRQCSAGKIAVHPESTEDQVLCIKWFSLKGPTTERAALLRKLSALADSPFVAKLLLSGLPSWRLSF
jgi:hypothetical protein